MSTSRESEIRSFSSGKCEPPSKTATSMIKARALRYKRTVDPTPGIADENKWWRKIVRLLTTGLNGASIAEEDVIRNLNCPDGLKLAMSNQFPDELSFRAAIFEALRTGLAEDMLKFVEPNLNAVIVEPSENAEFIEPKEHDDEFIIERNEYNDFVESDNVAKKKSVDEVDDDEFVDESDESSQHSIPARKRPKHEESDEDYVPDECAKKPSATATVKKASAVPIIFAMTEKYAIGFKKEVNGEQKHGVTTMKKGKPDTHSGISYLSSADHGACLFEKDPKSGKWTVMDCLSIVELKMANCKRFDDGANGQQLAEALGDDFLQRTAIAQVMIHTMGWVVPSLAKLGRLGEDIPWAVVVGNKSKSRTSHSYDDDLNRWVSGRIYPPVKCGDEFYYAVTGFEKFQPDNDCTALSVYLETLHFGLDAAKTWLLALENDSPYCQPVPASGKELRIGNTQLPGLTLCGSPYIRRSEGDDDHDDDDGYHWKLNQGEMFIGPLNWSILPKAEDPNFFVFRQLGENNNDVIDVAVKVSSLAVHNYLTLPTTAFQTLLGIKNMIKRAEKERSNYEMAKTIYRLAREISELKGQGGESTGIDEPTEPKRSDYEVTVPPDISDVLLAVHNTRIGLITIMVDLSKYGFMVLKPKKCNQKQLKHQHTLHGCDDKWNGVSLGDLWCAFLKLVRTVLIPLASIDVVHPDIRPGYNETSNILVQFVRDDENQLSDVIMKLIDYESVNTRSNMRVGSFGTDHRYVSMEGINTAPQYLWWQCVLIAYAWKNKKTQEYMVNTNVQSNLSKLKEDEELQNEPERTGWLESFGTDELMTDDLALKLGSLFG